MVSTSINADNVPYVDTPKIYASDGTYMGRMSDNTSAYDSISNPNSIYGSKSSADNIHDPYGAYGANPSYPDQPVLIIEE